MKTEKEIRTYLNELKRYRKELTDNFASDYEVIGVDSMIDAIMWVLHED